jgi:hypothetical protein
MPIIATLRFGYYLGGVTILKEIKNAWKVGTFNSAINAESSDNFETNISSIGLATF